MGTRKITTDISTFLQREEAIIHSALKRRVEKQDGRLFDCSIYDIKCCFFLGITARASKIL